MNSLQASLDLRVPKQKVWFALHRKSEPWQSPSFLPLPVQTVPVADTDGQYPTGTRESTNKS